MSVYAAAAAAGGEHDDWELVVFCGIAVDEDINDKTDVVVGNKVDEGVLPRAIVGDCFAIVGEDVMLEDVFGVLVLDAEGCAVFCGL
jgi:hypothetical protein